MIKATQTNIINEKNKSYYKQLKDDFKILDYVIHYESDFTKGDRKQLFKYKGDFIFGCRETGTNLIKFTKIETETKVKSCNNCLYNETCSILSIPCEHFKDNSVEVAKDSFNVWIIGKPLNYQWNKRFFYGHNGIVEEKTLEEIQLIFQEYCNEKYKYTIYR